MRKSNFSAVLKATKLSVFVVGFIAIATVPALAMGGGGGGGHAQYMKAISGSGGRHRLRELLGQVATKARAEISAAPGLATVRSAPR